MRFSRIAVCIFLSVVSVASIGRAEELADIQKRARTRADEIMAFINANKSIKDTLIKSLEEEANAYHRKGTAPSSEISAADKVWMDYVKAIQAFKAGVEKNKPAEPAVVSKVLKNPCSEALKKLKDKFSYIVEAFASGPAGTNVCVVDLTSDFDQGDEPKWQKPWLENMDLFIENPERDASSKEFTIKSSRLIKNSAGQKIGVLHIATTVK